MKTIKNKTNNGSDLFILMFGLMQNILTALICILVLYFLTATFIKEVFHEIANIFH